MVRVFIILLVASLLFSCSSPGPRLYPQSFDSGKKSLKDAQPLMAIHWLKQALNEAHKQDNTKWEYRALQDLFYISALIESVQENGKYSESQNYHELLSKSKWDKPQNKHSREAQSNFLKQSCDYTQSQEMDFKSTYKEFSIALCKQQFSQNLNIASNPKNIGLSSWQQGRYKLLQNKNSEAISPLETALEESKLKSKWLQRSLILRDLSKAYSDSDSKRSAVFLERSNKQIKALEL